MKFQNFEIFLLKITKNNYPYSVTCFKITSYFHIFIVHTCSIGALNLLQLHYGQISNKYRIDDDDDDELFLWYD